MRYKVTFAVSSNQCLTILTMYNTIYWYILRERYRINLVFPFQDVLY